MQKLSQRRQTAGQLWFGVNIVLVCIEGAWMRLGNKYVAGGATFRCKLVKSEDTSLANSHTSCPCCCVHRVVRDDERQNSVPDKLSNMLLHLLNRCCAVSGTLGEEDHLTGGLCGAQGRGGEAAALGRVDVRIVSQQTSGGETVGSGDVIAVGTRRHIHL